MHTITSTGRKVIQYAGRRLNSLGNRHHWPIPSATRTLTQMNDAPGSMDKLIPSELVAMASLKSSKEPVSAWNSKRSSDYFTSEESTYYGVNPREDLILVSK